MGDGDHLDGVRRALANPVEPEISDADFGAELGAQDTRWEGPDAPQDYGHYGDGEDNPAPPRALPDDCPVTPVGTENGLFYFLTALGEMRDLKPDQVANKHIVAMFAPRSDYLFTHWPRRKLVGAVDPAGKPILDDDGNQVKEWQTTGWRNDDVSMLLMDVCARRGVWNARERVRGRGGWIADDGSFIYHAGDKILFAGGYQPPGMFEGMVYPTAPTIPRPADKYARAVDLAPKLAAQLRLRGADITENISAGGLVLELFKTWNWQRKQVDPLLLLGWNISARMGAANDYRPVCWVTGDKATGKSHLQKSIGFLQGQALLQTSDASEAAVRQLLGQQSLPVAIDEAEAEEDNRKMLALVKLARLAASSQGNIVRGGQDHVAHEFRATACFLFSSILVPPIPPQDKSRLSVLELNELPAGSREPNLDKRELGALAAQMHRQIADRWHRWPEVLAAFRDAMIDFGGHGGRIADQFGTLLAAAHLVLDEGMPAEEELLEWGTRLSLETLAEASDNADEATRCAQHMLTSPAHIAGHGAPRLVAEWLAEATAPKVAFGPDYDEVERLRRSAELHLGKIGMRTVVGSASGGGEGVGRPVAGRVYVAIAVSHQGLARLFDGSRWQQGVWSQALGRVPGAVKNWATRIAKTPIKAVLVPVDQLISHDVDPDDAGAQAESGTEGVRL